ncbi:hypothetical protein [Onishia taeanensis]|nr:hypothetical protein [Halomonas taeanensis]
MINANSASASGAPLLRRALATTGVALAIGVIGWAWWLLFWGW